MPKMVKLAPNPDYRPTTDDDKEMFAQVKKRGSMEVSFVTAQENLRNSKGMLAMVVEEAREAAQPGPRRLEDMDGDELKIVMASLGIKTDKRMKRDDVIRLCRARMDEIVIED